MTKTFLIKEVQTNKTLKKKAFFFFFFFFFFEQNSRDLFWSRSRRLRQRTNLEKVKVERIGIGKKDYERGFIEELAVVLNMKLTAE